MGAGEWAAESLHGCTHADPSNMIQGPIENAKRRKSPDNHARALDKEEFPLQDLVGLSKRQSERRQKTNLQESKNSHIAITGKLHILRKVRAFDSSDVPEVEKPDISQKLSLKHKSCNNSVEIINVDLAV